MHFASLVFLLFIDIDYKEEIESDFISLTMLKLESWNAYRFDVFLSFRGEDTRKYFTDHLYTALCDQGLITFRDDEEIERGESIKSELEKGI